MCGQPVVPQWGELDQLGAEGVDLVMIGCGYADRFADELAQNHCMTAAQICSAAPS